MVTGKENSNTIRCMVRTYTKALLPPSHLYKSQLSYIIFLNLLLIFNREKNLQNLKSQSGLPRRQLDFIALPLLAFDIGDFSRLLSLKPMIKDESL